MKYLFLAAAISIAFASRPGTGCGDNTVYANKKQTEHDSRFDSFPKIKEIPKYTGGEEELHRLVKQNLELSDAAKTQIFRLNFRFTVTCEGRISNVMQIGNKKADDWTNIKEVIQSTEGKWTPAKKNGQPVDCVYFTALTINGSEY